MSEPVIAQPSATVVLLRDAPSPDGGVEVLLGQRGAELDFHGGEWVFPGGRVDPEDCLGGCARDSREAAQEAAVRECMEEVGVAVSRSALAAWSHWTTPLDRRKRFATWFFLAPFEGGELRADGAEMQSCRFMSPREALAAQAAGELGLPPPTYVTLAELLPFGSVTEALAAASVRTLPVILPRPQQVPDGMVSLYPGDAGYASDLLEHDGPQHRLIMRTSGWRYVCDLG